MKKTKNGHQPTSRIDLHLHTTASDGTLSPNELVYAANENDLKIISITDHDTIEGVSIAKQVADSLGITIISGLEISSRYHNGTLHILGYDVDIKSPYLIEKLNFCQEQRKQRNTKIIKKLQNIGYNITYEEMNRHTAGVYSLGRPHIASVLVSKGIVPDMQAAFDQFLGVGGKAFVSKDVFTARESIEIIKKSGGHPFLAHPVTLNREEKELIDFINQLKSDGLEGIEQYSSYHQVEHIILFERISRELDLRVSAGSDFHGAHKPNIKLGLCNLGQYVMLEQVSEELLPTSI